MEYHICTRLLSTVMVYMVRSGRQIWAGNDHVKILHDRIGWIVDEL